MAQHSGSGHDPATPPALRDLLEGLNTDLAHEYQAVISYLLASQLVSGPLRPSLSEFLQGEIEDELGHAKLLAHKIVALGAEPTAEPAPVELGRSARENFQILLEAERDTIRRYTQRIKQADAAGQVGLRVDLEEIVSDETRHMEELERILGDWE